MTIHEIIRAVAYAHVPNGALIMEKDSPCQDESIIHVLNAGGAILIQAQRFEIFLQGEMEDSDGVSVTFFEHLHYAIRIHFFMMLEAGLEHDEARVVCWNKQIISRLREVALRLGIEYTVVDPPDPLED